LTSGGRAAAIDELMAATVMITYFVRSSYRTIGIWLYRPVAPSPSNFLHDQPIFPSCDGVMPRRDVWAESRLRRMIQHRADQLNFSYLLSDT
jgi:hypothetical protein